MGWLWWLRSLGFFNYFTSWSVCEQYYCVYSIFDVVGGPRWCRTDVMIYNLHHSVHEMRKWSQHQRFNVNHDYGIDNIVERTYALIDDMGQTHITTGSEVANKNSRQFLFLLHFNCFVFLSIFFFFNFNSVVIVVQGLDYRWTFLCFCSINISAYCFHHKCPLGCDVCFLPCSSLIIFVYSKDQRPWPSSLCGGALVSMPGSLPQKPNWFVVVCLRCK